GPLHVRADHARRAAVRGHRPQRLDERLLRRRYERRLIRGDTALEERRSGDVVVVGRGREEVDAAVAVDLEVDEPGNGDAATGTAREADADDDAVLDLDVARHELAADEGRLHVESHFRSGAGRAGASATRE